MWKLIGIFYRGSVIIHSSFPYIKGIRLGTCEEIFEVAVEVVCMGLNGLNEVGERLVKDGLLRCMRQVLKWGFCQNKFSGSRWF